MNSLKTLNKYAHTLNPKLKRLYWMFPTIMTLENLTHTIRAEIRRRQKQNIVSYVINDLMLFSEVVRDNIN